MYVSIFFYRDSASTVCKKGEREASSTNQFLPQNEATLKVRLHTGKLKCANSLSLVYTSKRCSYSNKVHKACKQLAAIYWNFHMNLEAATTKAGEQIVTRKYNQRTNDWDVKIITVKKKFEYIPVMMVKIFNMRKEDTDSVTRWLSLNESDPALLALTIAEKQAPPSKELFMARKSRFQSGTEDHSENSSSSNKNSKRTDGKLLLLKISKTKLELFISRILP
ncbi:unnamed protein product [Porites lobata]|uniref:Uncharacterized protein n=1 Tax=Porites lobata TaxID=104759 RepID=A0ABN8NAN2_9CNID|nr:unnamed protein product [Porites lobata]